MHSRTWSTAMAALLPVLAATAQEARPLCIVNARILTMEGPPIERGAVLVRGGKIAGVGADVAVPAGAIVVDAAGGTVMPGLVAAWSRAGLERRQPPPGPQPQGRRGGRGQMQQPGGPMPSGAVNQAAAKIADRLDPNQPVFAELLRAGATTLSLVPGGRGLPGIGAVLRPDGKTSADLVQNGDAFLLVSMARESAVKKLLKDGFAAARKVVEERHKPKAETPAQPAAPSAQPTKPADGKEPAKSSEPPKSNDPPKPEPKPGEQGGDKKPAPTQEPEKKPEPKKDPNVEVLADLLEGKRRALLEIESAADLEHWFHACGDTAFPRTIVVTRHDVTAGTMDMVVDQVQKLKAPVLLPLGLPMRARTRYLINPARILHDAGIEVGFVTGDTKEELRRIWYELMELVRAGLPADVALKGVTLMPAKALGVDHDVGSLKTGKRADLLLWTGDPLDPESRLRSIWLAGQEVEASPRKGAER